MALTPKRFGTANRHPEVSAPTSDYPTRMIDLLSVRYRSSAGPQSGIQPGKSEYRPTASRRQSSERWASRLQQAIRSLVPLVAIVSLLVGIVCLAKLATLRPIHSKPEEQLAGADMPSQGLVTFGQAMQQLGARH